jgi:hypothetical protein
MHQADNAAVRAVFERYARRGYALWFEQVQSELWIALRFDLDRNNGFLRTVVVGRGPTRFEAAQQALGALGPFEAASASLRRVARVERMPDKDAVRQNP